MGDRCGSRESKGTSLKKSKSNPGGTAAKKKKAAKLTPSSLQSAMPPMPKVGKYVDCGSAMLSRQFDRDRDRVLARAEADGVAAVITWFSDVEKQSSLYDLCKASSGHCYFLSGVHPDNIDRTNKKSHEGWLEKVEDLARKAECVGILAGMNLAREVGTHFAQESMLRSACALADKVVLPMVIHCPDSASMLRALEILREEEWLIDQSEEEDASTGHKKVIFHDGITASGGQVSTVLAAVEAGCYFMVSGVGIADSDAEAVARANQCVAAIPPDRLLSCTDSPWRTPQNIPDTYLRTLRNEPCNLLFVNSAIASALQKDLEETNELLKSNALRAFGLEFVSGEASEAMSSGVRDISIAERSTTATASASHDAEHTNSGAANASASSGPEKPSAPPASAATASAHDNYYCCHKCRTKLFLHAAVSHHAVFEAAKTVFRIGQEEGVCKDVIFVPYTTEQVDALTGMTMGKGKSATVECSHCGVKVGKFCPGEGLCACGASVAGPVVRILTAKVDVVDMTVAQEELVARARLEAETNVQLAVLDEEAEEDRRREEREENKRNNKKGKKVASQNKGNFSSFRNKTFVPNASRSNKKGAEADNEGGGSDDESDDGVEAAVEMAKVNHSKKAGKGKNRNAFIVEDDSEDNSS
jgi:TatD DNase family protein